MKENLCAQFYFILPALLVTSHKLYGFTFSSNGQKLTFRGVGSHISDRQMMIVSEYVPYGIFSLCVDYFTLNVWQIMGPGLGKVIIKEERYDAPIIVNNYVHGIYSYIKINRNL